MTADIRHLHTPKDADAVVELQRSIWRADEVPGHVLLTAAHNGGLLAGAFVGDRLAAFVFGFPGLDGSVHPPQLKHCSHQLGVHPDFRNQGLGFALKRFQRDYVAAQGIELITWTFDPLLAANAHLNIARLGAVCNAYLEDAYGPLDDGLNAGLQSDRFQVELWVNSPRVRAAIRRELAPGVLPRDAFWVNPLEHGLPAPPGPFPDMLEWPASVALAIPPDFLKLKAGDSAAAAAWRWGTRTAFVRLFAEGYVVVDFLRQANSGCYLLERLDQSQGGNAARPRRASADGLTLRAV